MRSSIFQPAVLASAIFATSIQLALSQLIPDLSACVSTCIAQSGDDNCSVSDTACLCRASNGNFLPDLVTCMHGNCDYQLDTNLLLMPLQIACIAIGAPIAPSAIMNAEQLASSLAVQATVTVTGSSAPAVTPMYTTLTSTSTTTTVNSAGSTLVVVYPETYTHFVTITTASTATAPGHSVTNVIPIIIVSTDSAGSTYTSTTTEAGSVSTVTTTDSAGNTQTVVSTYTQAASAGTGVQTLTTTSSVGSTYTTTQTASSSSSGTAGVGAGSGRPSGTSYSSTVTETTSIAAESTTGSTSSNVPGASTTGPSDPDNTNSSPFAMQSGAARRSAGCWLSLGVLLIVLLVLF